MSYTLQAFSPTLSTFIEMKIEFNLYHQKPTKKEKNYENPNKINIEHDFDYTLQNVC